MVTIYHDNLKNKGKKTSKQHLSPCCKHPPNPCLPPRTETRVSEGKPGSSLRALSHPHNFLDDKILSYLYCRVLAIKIVLNTIKILTSNGIII